MEEYRVEELTNVEPGQPRYEITAFLKDNLMARALITVGQVARLGDMQFLLINDRPCVKFRISNPVALNVYPKTSQAEDFLMHAVSEAEKIRRIMKAVQIVDRETKTG